MIRSMNIQSGDCLFEIGPGEGALTRFLADSPASSVHLVEKDRRLIPWLESRYGQDPRIHIHNEDILEFNIDEIVHKKKMLRVIGNLPYNITSPILFKLLDIRQSIQDVTVTIQKEVGERLASEPGGKAYGIPSVLFQVYAEVRLLFTIPPRAFYPAPKVESAVISICFYDKPLAEIHDEAYFRRMVQTVFGQRRKMMRNTLKPIVPESVNPDTIPFDLTRRPETLAPAEMIRLSNLLTKNCQDSFGKNA